MSAENDRVIVTHDVEGGVGVHVHHRDFPEIRANGADSKEGAIQLSNHLTRALDSALTKWRRDAIEHAIVEVQEYSKTGP
jgi:hypothetical protein